MQLRTCRSLSPSAVLCLESKPVEFWFRYIGPEEWKSKFAQTRPMAFGSAFDGAAKAILAQRNKMDASRFGVKSMVDEAFHKDRKLINICTNLAAAYVNGPPGKHLKKFRPTILEGDPGIVKFGSVPIYGKLDVATTEPRILDFKMTGWNSSAYPVVGYADGWDYDFRKKKFTRIGAHKFHGTENASLVRNKPDWAFQIATYDMIYQLTNKLDPMKGGLIGVDQITLMADGKARFTHIREQLTPEFKREVQERYKQAWRKVKLGKVLPPEYAGLPIEDLSMYRSAAATS